LSQSQRPRRRRSRDAIEALPRSGGGTGIDPVAIDANEHTPRFCSERRTCGRWRPKWLLTQFQWAPCQSQFPEIDEATAPTDALGTWGWWCLARPCGVVAILRASTMITDIRVCGHVGDRAE
jgi:hypothetical protein